MLRYREIWLSLALAAGAALLYRGALANGFVNLDDGPYVFQNPMVQRGLCRSSVTWAFSAVRQSNWHPLTWLSLMADYELYGLNPWGFHATNVALHAANTVALFWALRQMTGLVGRSAWVAAFFAAHPLHVESVAWIAERKDVLSTFLLLLSLLAWLAHVRRPAVWKIVLAIVLFAFSLMAKAMGVTLPLILLLVDFWPLSRWQKARPAGGEGAVPAIPLLIEKLPFFVLSAIAAAVTVYAQAHGGAMRYGQSLSLSSRLFTVFVNYATYLGQTIWPVHLAVLYPHPGANLPFWKPLAALAVLAAITLAVVRTRSTRPALLFGWLWFLITLLPVIGLIQVGGQSTADRYMYLPIVGLLVALCWGAYDLAGRSVSLHTTVSVALTICLLLASDLTIRQVAHWRDSQTLWEHALAITPPTVWACTNYGMALEERGKEDEAEQWFRKALEIDPKAFGPHFNLGIILSHMGRDAEAAQHLSIALESTPNHPLVLWNLGVVEERLGHYRAALGYYEMAEQADPQSSNIQQDIHRVRAKAAGR